MFPRVSSPFKRVAEEGIADLRVGRLKLVAMTPEVLAADEAGSYAELGRMLGAKIAAEWPPADWEPHVFRFLFKQIAEHPETLGWNRYVLLGDGFGLTWTLVGCTGAFVKPFGEAEMGYSTLPQFQRRGIATLAAQTMAEWLLQQDGVVSVCATTFPRLAESIKVMERCGMTFVGCGDEAGTVMYRRSRE